MKIAILLSEPYPFGMACTKRIHLYAKGLFRYNNDIEIIIPMPTENPGKIRNDKVTGEYEGINFKYSYKTTVRSKSFLGRRIHDFISLLNALFLLIQFNPDILLIAGKPFKYVLLGKVCSLLTKAKLVREKSEVPFYQYEKISWLKKVRIKAEFQLFDGLLVISETLKDFFLNNLSLKMKVLVVPILINSSNAKLNKHSPATIEPNLIYTGSLINKKDGILIIIKAFSRILKENRNLRLKLTGEIANSIDKEKILTLIDNLGIKGKIELLGYISEEKLQILTSTATALLLAKPNNRQNRFNMATKIGEYLLTGRPIIISTIDPVCQYLTNRQDAFIVNPNEEAIAREVKFIIDNPREAGIIGLNGKKSAIRLFDYKIHTLRIDDFLKNL